MSSIKQNRYSEIPQESIHGIYGVNYYFQTENNTMQRLQFEVAVVFCGQYMENYYKYCINKNQFIVNRNESDEYLYDIAKKCANTIDNDQTKVMMKVLLFYMKHLKVKTDKLYNQQILYKPIK